MGNCTKSGASYEERQFQQEDICFQKACSKLSQSQLRSLIIIYQDLAERDPTSKLNLENFLLFFHKNGFWGQRLFKEFDADQSNYITQKQFIKGIVRIFKTTQEQKIKLLYHFFQKQGRQGITFNDFIVVLYNYPKTDLKQIFNDQEFVDTEIKKRLVEIKKGHNQTARLENGGEATQYRIQGSDVDSDMPIPSAYGFKGVLQQLKKKRMNQPQTSLNINVDGKSIQVKTSNIQHLVKKFAKKLFQEFKIDQINGRLGYNDFHCWIEKHKNLYKNYYDGFHNQVWQSDQTKIPKYIKAKNEKQSSGKMQIQNSFEEVHLYFMNSTIIVSKQDDKYSPVYIICLDGLAVKKIFDNLKGFGIQITHRDGLYKVKKIYMKNQELVMQWMELLKFFKGVSVQQQYDMGQKIGTGKFSIVYACKQKKTNLEYAIKVIQSSKLDNEARLLIAHETSIMSVLNHPLLVHFKQSIQTKTHLYIVTQLVKGLDLYEYVKINGVMPQIEAAKIVRQLILGVKHLHDIGIIHRDLKPENIMLITQKNINQQKQSLKIIDFGFSVYKNSLANLDPSQLLAGTPSFIAPQILKNQLINQKIDNFAIGAIIYFVLSGEVPFNGRSINQMFAKTLDGSYSFDSKPWRAISLQAKDLIDKLLLSSAQMRITLQEALKHNWFIKTHKR